MESKPVRPRLGAIRLGGRSSRRLKSASERSSNVIDELGAVSKHGIVDVGVGEQLIAGAADFREA